MYSTHDHIEYERCYLCNEKVPYYEIHIFLEKRICEYCLEEAKKCLTTRRA